MKLRKETLDEFQAILNLAALAAEIGPGMFEESIQTCSDDTELKDCIANAKFCKTSVSIARVSVLVKLLEKSLLQDLEKLKKGGCRLLWPRQWWHDDRDRQLLTISG